MGRSGSSRLLCALVGLAAITATLAGCTGPEPEARELATPFAADGGRMVARGVALPLATQGIPSADAAVANSGRGEYIWLNIPADPEGWPVMDLYWRDQLQWGQDLETAPGKYNFTSVDKGIAAAEKMGGRFSFRIMSYCPGCGDNIAPQWLPQQSTGAPDWNSDRFLSSWESLMRALGEKYNTDPRVGYIDFGGYGAAGEWYYEPKYGDKITDANARRMMRAVLDAFPDKYVLIPWMNQYPEIATALSDRVGIRNDCIGGFEQEYYSKNRAVQTAWERAPMVGEWCANKDASSAIGVQTIRDFHLSTISSGNYPRRYTQMKPEEQDQFRMANLIAGYRYALTRLSLPSELSAGKQVDPQLTWENSGSSATYDQWNVSLRFTPVAPGKSFDIALADDLKTVREGQATLTSQATLPSDARGAYVVSVLVTDPSGYLAPMRLALSGRQADGSYVVGQVNITE